MAVFKATSRYRGATVTEVDNGNGDQPYTVLKKMLVVPETTEDYYILIDQGNEFKPDLISYQLYGAVDYAWALLEVNGLRSWLEMTAGSRLRVPPLEAIQAAVALSHDQ